VELILWLADAGSNIALIFTLAASRMYTILKLISISGYPRLFPLRISDIMVSEEFPCTVRTGQHTNESKIDTI
jgi:hypothetical protein